MQHLGDNLTGAQMTRETHLACRAKNTTHGAARLSAHTSGVPSLVAHDDGLDFLAVLKAQQELVRQAV